MSLKNLIPRLLDTVLPETCIVCGENVKNRCGAFPICADCAAGIPILTGKRCLLCSKPLFSENSLCMECKKADYSFKSNYSVFAYNEAIQACITAYKGKGITSIKTFFAAFLFEAYHKYYNGLLLVPTPFRPEAKHKRGWDPVTELCKVLEKRYGIPWKSLLERKGKCLEQKTLSREERIKNLAGKVHVKPNMENKVPDQVLLLDDVFTTGATVNECSRILKENGAKEVFILTLARD